MKIGIMQPYFIPYIGYWQLMNAVDRYVVYDDVNFINRGWINRNRILLGGQARHFNVPLLGASQNKRINEVIVNHDKELAEKNLRTIENAYRKAPYFMEVYPLVQVILNCGKYNLAEYLLHSIQVICRYIGIDTPLILSSSLSKDCSQKGQDKILAICELLGADEYYNAIGGRSLYFEDDFARKEIILKFLRTDDIIYTQFGNNFEKNLSILDVLMFNSVAEVRDMLGKYKLLSASGIDLKKE